MLLDYFIVDDYVEKVIEILDKINHEGYYVKMAAAWCLAEIGIKYNDLLMKYLNCKNNELFSEYYDKAENLMANMK